MRTREASLRVLLTVTTGRRLTTDERLYEFLNWMTGDRLSSLQLPEVVGACADAVTQQHPEIADIRVPDNLWAPLMVESWLMSRMALYGSHRKVRKPRSLTYPPLAAAASRRIYAGGYGSCVHSRPTTTVLVRDGLL